MNLNTMLQFALLAGEAGGADNQGGGGMSLVVQYIIYAAVIVVGIIVLLLLRRAGRLPSHRKLYEQLQAHLQNMEHVLSALQNGKDARFRFFKTISKLLYTTDKLVHATSALARKERDTDIDNISTQLEKVHYELAPYKYGKRQPGDLAGVEQALLELRKAVQVMDNVLARDEQLKARSVK